MAAATSVATTQLYMDEKWKLSKKEGSRSRSSTSFNSSLMRNSSTSSLMRNSSNTPSLMRNSSNTPSLTRNSSTTSLMRNSSTSSLVRNSSQRRSSFSRKCSSLVKEQRAKFYIMRRCVTMLICWRDYGDA